MNLFKSRKFRQGSVATAISVLVIALIVAANMVTTLVSDKYSLSLDLSTGKVFGISVDTRQFLDALAKDVDVYILNTEENFTVNGEYFVQANQVIKKYAQESSHIRVNYVDIVRDPTFVSRYPEYQLDSSSILVTSGEHVSTLTPYDLFNIETNYYTGGAAITASKAEQAMTSAILNVTSDKKIVVSFLSGHNETGTPGFSSLLEMNNYQIIEQNILTEEINPAATIAVIVSPARDFTDSELKKLDKFLENDGKYGKTLFYLASNEQPELPVLGAFLSDWGIQVGSGVVFESNQNGYLNMTPYMPIMEIGSPELAQQVAKDVLARQMIMTVPFARPLGIAYESKGGITTTTLLQFSQTSGVRPMDAPETWQPTQADMVGPIPALVMGQMLKYDGTTPLKSTVLVAGSSMSIDDNLLASTSIANSQYFLSLMDTLAERQDVVRIESKTIGGAELGITSGQAILLAIILIVLFPLALLIFGIIVWLRRRHR